MAEANAKILVVDDTLANLGVLEDMLHAQGYTVSSFPRGAAALESLKEELPDLILLDIMMPDMDGYQVCRRLKADPKLKDIPVIFLSALSETNDKLKAFAEGGADYITKPFQEAEVLARVKSQLNQKALSDFLKDKAGYLEKEVEKRTAQVRAVQEVTILALASLAETRDNDTSNHLRRTQLYIRTLALRLRQHPRYQAALADGPLALILKSAPLHDIGKVGIPDRILLKPGKLDEEEFAVMKTHTTIGFQALEQAERQLGSRVEFLQTAKQIVRSHHEKWDGTGYPEGLAGEQIPISARLMALADVYDALISRRVYKEGMSHEKACEIIIQGWGTFFDPAIVDVFKTCHAEFQKIALAHADTDADLKKISVQKR